MVNQPTSRSRFIIDPKTLVMYDTETGAVFVYVSVVDRKEVSRG